ncbi:hypothetical protein AcV7_005657 [Taiwanofungus camphoratus]|nr:hypothetical protein AcV7_005657 [Antrodia cinnamomea]
MERDVIYFTKDEHAGVCIFHRRQTAEEGHRGFRLSSLGILLAKSTRPRPWRHVPALKKTFNDIYSSLEDWDTLVPVENDWDPARAFFEERKVRRTDLGGAGEWKGWDAEFDNDLPDTDPTIHLPHILRILGPSSLTLYKHILGRRRILIYTFPPVEAACILCQVAADICYQYQAGGDDGSLQDEDEPGRTLKGKSKEGVKVMGMVTLSDFDKLSKESKSGRGWIACTTDAIFLEKPSYYDLLIDLRTSTPNTRPAFYVPKSSEQPNGRGPSYRLSVVRFTWSDVKLWTELDSLLQVDASERADCCDPRASDPSNGTGTNPRSSSSSWTDIWRVYEDVCVMCAGLWMGSWRGTPSLGYSHTKGRSESFGSIRLEGADDLTLRKTSNLYVRSVGMGIEGRPAFDASTSSGRSLRGMRRSSGMSVWTWASSRTDAPAPPEPCLDPVIGSPLGERANLKDIGGVEAADNVDEGRRARQVLTTLALLQTFHINTSIMLARLAELLLMRRLQLRHDGTGTVSTVLLSPKDVISFELGPFSGLDARFVEWLGEEYGGDVKVIVRRGWRDLVGLIFGYG